jgi:hypothetical protein
MKRTPPIVAAAAALGLLAGLALEARAGTLGGEVSPHTVSVAWVAPGTPFPAGVETEGRGVVPPSAPAGMPKLQPMRVRVPPRDEVRRERERQREESRKMLVRGDCRHRAQHPMETRRS